MTELDYGSSNLKEVPEEIYEHSESLLKLSVESNTITELPSVSNLHQRLFFIKENVGDPKYNSRD